MKFLALFFLFIALIIEVSFTTLPLVFLILLCLTVIYRENFVFLLAFVFGLLFDLFSFKTLGISSIFFVTFLFLVLLYQRKFEIATGYFVFIASFIGGFGFLFLMGYNNNLVIEAITSSITGLAMFKLLQSLNKNKVTDN